MTAKNKKDKEHQLPQGFEKKQARKAAQALFAALNAKKDDLFLDQPRRINLDITAFKSPEGINHFYDIHLPYSPYPPKADTILVVSDEKRVVEKKDRIDPDIKVNRIKDKLRDEGIQISEVYTLLQLRQEFETFNEKRGLAKRLDIVLVEDCLKKMAGKALGREFYKKKKIALTLPLDEEKDWKDLFEKTLRKSTLNISLKGTTTTFLVGGDHLSEEELTENICKVAHWLGKKYPGGWKNVSKLSIYSEKTPPIIAYFSLEQNIIKKAITKGGMLPEPIDGEVSTLIGKRVRVHPRGDVEVYDAPEDDEFDPKKPKKEEEIKEEEDELEDDAVEAT